MNDDLYPRFSDSELASRYVRTRTLMQEAAISALILHGTAGAYQEIQYLSNFLVTREAMLVFPQAGEPTLVVQYYNHLPNAHRVSSIDDVRWGGSDIATTTPMQNPTACVPAQQQSVRRLSPGDVLITEISAHYHGYPGQILRPFAIGVPPTAIHIS